MSRFKETKKLLSKYEKWNWIDHVKEEGSYSKSINMTVDIVKKLIGEGGHSCMSASYVGLGVIKYTHGYKNGFTIFSLDDLLYPQMDPLVRLMKFIRENDKALRIEAKKRLKEKGQMHPDVKKHMQDIVNGKAYWQQVKR